MSHGQSHIRVYSMYPDFASTRMVLNRIELRQLFLYQDSEYTIFDNMRSQYYQSLRMCKAIPVDFFMHCWVRIQQYLHMAIVQQEQRSGSQFPFLLWETLTALQRSPSVHNHRCQQQCQQDDTQFDLFHFFVPLFGCFTRRHEENLHMDRR